MNNNKHLNKHLTVEVCSDGILQISIGVDILAFAALRSEYSWDLANPDKRYLADPRTKFKITDPKGFAADVREALLEEAEDGSSLLTRVLDEACKNAIEQGSEHFSDSSEET